MGIKQPNILWITTDHLQGATLNSDSECILPNIRRLASEGMLFSRTYTPMPVCCPVRAMWVSGGYPWHNGVFTQVHSTPSISRDMFTEVDSYAEHLRAAGYRTGFNGKWHASQLRSPLEFGYEEMGFTSGVPSNSIKVQDRHKVRKQPALRGGLTFTAVKEFTWPGSEPFVMWGFYEGPVENLSTSRLASSAIDMITEYSRDERPWHITVHFPEPHDPYSPHKKYIDMYEKVDIKLSESFYDSFEGKPGMHKREAGIWGDVTGEDVIEGRRYYYAYCTQIDEQIGCILEAVKAAGQEENTVVFYTSDHGDMLGSHRMWSKSWMPYEDIWRVPGIVKYPGVIPAGRICNKLIQTHYIPYTILDIAKAKPLQYKDGRSLAPLFSDLENDNWDNAAFCVGYGCEFLVTQRMVITEQFKYMFNGFDFDEMYDLKNDPNELHNLIDDPAYASERSELRKKLYEFMAQYQDPFGDVSPYDNNYSAKPGRYGMTRYLPRF